MTATGPALLRTARMRGEPLGPEHEEEIAALTLPDNLARVA